MWSSIGTGMRKETQVGLKKALLIENILTGLMELPEDERKRILFKYIEAGHDESGFEIPHIPGEGFQPLNG